MGAVSRTMFTRHRSLVRWTVPIPLVAAEAEQVERTRGRPGHGPDPRFLCLKGAFIAINGLTSRSFKLCWASPNPRTSLDDLPARGGSPPGRAP